MEGTKRNIRFWKNLIRAIKEPEDDGYIALFISITQNKTCSEALQEVKGTVVEP